MKNIAISLCFCSILLFACHKEDAVPNPPVKEDYNFSILPSSSHYLMPYHSRDSVIFEDSLGNELILRIKTSFNNTKTGTRYFYNVHTAGDTVKYDYTSVGDVIQLKDDSIKYFFKLELFPQLYTPNSNAHSVKAVDGLHVWLSQPESLSQTYSVFFRIIDFRDCAEEDKGWVPNTIESSRTFLGTTFLEVEHTDYTYPKAVVYFNKTYGIVAFSDYDHKLWRLKL